MMLVYDKTAALEHLNYNEELFRAVIRIQLEDSPLLIERIREGIDKRDHSMVSRSAQALADLAAVCGARQIQNDALELVQLGRIHSFSTISLMLGVFSSSVSLLNTQLEMELRGK